MFIIYKVHDQISSIFSTMKYIIQLERMIKLFLFSQQSDSFGHAVSMGSYNILSLYGIYIMYRLLYWSDVENSVIERVSYSTTPGTNRTVVAGLSAPTGLAFDEIGRSINLNTENTMY